MVRQPKVHLPAKHSAIAPVIQVLNMQTQTPNLLFPFPQNRLNMQLRGKGLGEQLRRRKQNRKMRFLLLFAAEISAAMSSCRNSANNTHIQLWNYCNQKQRVTWLNQCNWREKTHISSMQISNSFCNKTFNKIWSFQQSPAVYLRH